MKSAFKSFSQSKYYSTKFNSAIFDGPVRIYFNQVNEDEALKIYYQVHDSLSDKLRKSADGNKNFFILLYPTVEDFRDLFAGSEETHIIENLNGDFVFATYVPLGDSFSDELISSLHAALRSSFMKEKEPLLSFAMAEPR